MVCSKEKAVRDPFPVAVRVHQRGRGRRHPQHVSAWSLTRILLSLLSFPAENRFSEFLSPKASMNGSRKVSIAQASRLRRQIIPTIPAVHRAMYHFFETREFNQFEKTPWIILMELLTTYRRDFYVI